MRALHALAPLALVALLLLAWEAACRGLHVAPYLVPPPSSVAQAMAGSAPALLGAAMRTLWMAIQALMMASLLANLLAVLVSLSRTLERAIKPLAVGLQVTPVVAIAPLVVIWSGIDHPGLILIRQSTSLELTSDNLPIAAPVLLLFRRRASILCKELLGDGPNNDGNPMREAHDRVIGQGIVVNGLPVMDDNANGYFPNLDKYYSACVAGGRGSFVIVVRAFKDFGAAMRHKLILEISQNEVPSKLATNPPAGKVLLKKIAATTEAPATPQVMRPGQNEFSDRCDIAGGFGGFGRF